MFQYMVYGIRIQKDSVYGIWYKDSEGFSIYSEGLYGIRIQKDSVYVYDIRIQNVSVYGIWYKDSEGFSIWYMV